jgi:uncharacterized protein
VKDDSPTFADIAFAPFAPRAPWWGGDLQTVSSYLRRRAPLDSYAAERLVLPMNDGTGDRLVATLSRPAESRALPLVVLIHGLSGDEDSVYIRRTAATALQRGYPVLRLNLRGAGLSRPLSRFQYHAGRTDDFAQALAALPPALTRNGIAAIGYSLGGNMLLKFLGERGRAAPLRAAVSVSAPIDLAATSDRMQRWRNYGYQAYLMNQIRAEAMAPASELSPSERKALARVRSIRDFDEKFSAPRNGFRDAAHYYEANAARNYLGGIAVPTLVIHALNDPWVPATPYVAQDWRRNGNLVPLFSKGGGHVGFHGMDRTTPWHDLASLRFLETVLKPA